MNCNFWEESGSYDELNCTKIDMAQYHSVQLLGHLLSEADQHDKTTFSCFSPKTHSAWPVPKRCGGQWSPSCFSWFNSEGKAPQCPTASLNYTTPLAMIMAVTWSITTTIWTWLCCHLPHQPAIMTRNLWGFPQSHHATAGTLLYIRPWPLLCNSPVILILPFNTNKHNWNNAAR
jgi:hypothetical protein